MTQKTTDAIVKAIGIVGHVLLTTFMVVFGILAVIALGLTFIEGEAFNLVGVVACSFITWVMHTIRRDTL
jgi:hypothetical protein